MTVISSVWFFSRLIKQIFQFFCSVLVKFLIYCGFTLSMVFLWRLTLLQLFSIIGQRDYAADLFSQHISVRPSVCLSVCLVYLSITKSAYYFTAYFILFFYIGLLILFTNKKPIACDKIFPEKVMHKNVNNIVKTKFCFHEYNGNFGKMVETEIIK